METFVATAAHDLKKAFIPAPETPEVWETWRNSLIQWADQKRKECGSPCYDLSAQAWASRAYCQGFLMLWDNELINHQTGTWNVDRYLDRADREFGGFDMVVLWNNYPNSGLDPRHQLNYYDDLPGGRAGLAAAIERFHARGVRVLIDHKPWVPGVPEGFDSVEEAYVDLVATCGLDGIYLDCSDGPSDSFREALQHIAGSDKIFVCEAPARLEPFGNAIGCWQQMTDDSTAPGTYRNRWLDRHQLVYESRRYFHDPIRELQRGWMNGGGFVVWENVFGYWATYSERCKSWMRLLFPAQRRFANWFIEGEWLPHVGGGSVTGVYVSQWILHGKSLWTVVNRRGHALTKVILTINDATENMRYFDIISGRELNVLKAEDGTKTLGGRLERDGLMGVIAFDALDTETAAFLNSQRDTFAHANWTNEPWDGEHRHTELPHKLTQVEPTVSAQEIPLNMIKVADFKDWMITNYRMRECGYIAGAVDELHVYDAFEKICPYSRKVDVRNVALDAFPVTNANYAAFLKATGYTPADARNFLKHWVDGHPPEGLENHPVVYVSLADARAYADWAGKRLPREEEWQAAAQGAARNPWPWGNIFDSSHCNSEPSGTTTVDAFPNGRTAEGFWDMCGNTWEMTESERTDGHTRYQILKGGSWYTLDGSSWLFDTGPRPANWGAKQILVCDAWDRCATIGFRCAIDLI